jgi:Zinc finger, C2H2 type
MKKINIILLILFFSHYYCTYSMIRKNFKNTPIKSTETSCFQEKKHICTTCKKSFKRPGNLNKHKRMFHEPPSPFKCLQCHKYFISQKNLDIHVKNYYCQKTLLSKFTQTIKIKTSLVNQSKILMIQPSLRPELLPYTTQQQITSFIIFPQINVQDIVPPLQFSSQYFTEKSLFNFNDTNQNLLLFNEPS